MGNSNSVLSASQSLYPSALGPLTSRSFMDTATPGHSISPHFNFDSSSTKAGRAAGYRSSPSPPPPPGPAPPVVSYAQDGYSMQSPQQQQQAPRSNGRTKHKSPPPSPFVNAATSNYIQAPAPLIKGPRIFAAMAAADNGNQSLDMSQQRPNPTPSPPSFPPNNQQQLRQVPSMSSVRQRETLYYDAPSLPPPPPTQNGYYTQHAPPPPPPPSTSYLPTPPMQQYDPPPPQPPSPPRDGQVDYLRTPRPRGASPRPLPDPATYTYPGPSTAPSSNSVRRLSVRAGHPLPIPPVSPPPATPPQSPSRKKLSKTRPQQQAEKEMQQHWPNGSATSLVSGESASWHSASGHSQGGQGFSQHGHGGGAGSGGGGSQLGHPSPSKGSFPHPQHNVHTHNGHRTLAKGSLPPTPVPEDYPYEQPVQVDEETIRKAGIPLDDDPFAKTEGVRMLSPTSTGGGAPSGLNGVASMSTLKESTTIKRPKSSKGDTSVVEDAAEKGMATKTVENAAPAVVDVQPVVVETPAEKKAREKEERRRERRERKAREKEARAREAAAAAAALQAASGASRNPSSLDDEPEPEPIVGDELAALNGRAPSLYSPSHQPQDGSVDAGYVDTTTFPLNKFVSNAQLLANLLSYFSFWDWCTLSSVTREVRIVLVQRKDLREEVLERYLRTVGYSRWAWSEEKEPLGLSLQDLADYMRGVSTPSHEYARVAKMYVHSLTVHPDIRDPSLEHTVRCLTASTRAYTRVMLRLRAQAEKEASSSSPGGRSGSTPPSASVRNGLSNGGIGGTNGYYGGMISRPGSRATSRAPSPTMSNFSHSHSHGPANAAYAGPGSSASASFRSPLFRLRRAPLLRVFVPSPEGDWLSDKSVLECEEECKRAGVLHLMRMGDVVWDIAVGDEGNVGRLVYDGKYLIDLDYTWNPIGDLPKYIPALAFPPSYFHRVIRTGVVTSNPVVHVDISPWGEEIAKNLQLLQDRVKTETPQGAYHNVVRWVHRSSFVIRPPARVMQRGPSINGRGQPHTPRIAIPDTDNLFIDSGWYGTIVVETEGTNEALADLQERCGPRAFPPRPRPSNPAQQKAQQEVKKVFRILREKSRPGEIWIKAVGIKERIL
ncbi:hypothetical protein EST38_g7633 [Candolleomyces aberdarensis]|uniref:Uncharacterized protein n=1 Tax=Candolleomyces aberdarensis TaxID=2316362 RepID=A0A4Q2DHH2_9AGAR|nr:hypothetical protein EST38_g7633 [Candolleomyces aberdarensis]